jgi:hypothetical protein
MDQREVLAPAVAHWQQVQQMDRELGAAKLQLLKDQQEHGSKLIRVQTHKVGWRCVFGALLGGVCFLLGLMRMTSRGLGLLQQRAQ